jgi:hypothetical protein
LTEGIHGPLVRWRGRTRKARRRRGNLENEFLAWRPDPAL